MTDEQIIQAVGLCANGQEDCRKCPLHSMYSANCIKKLMNITLDLIKRQQEKIEAIINGQETLSKALVTKDAEIERLEAEKDNLIRTYKACMTDAIKEFAERLNKNFETYTDDEEKNALYMRNLINNLVKELTEGKDDE